MNITKLTLQSCLLLAGPLLWADSPAVVSSPVADPVAEAVPILQASYPDFPALHYKDGDHLTDLIARSNGKISLVAPDVIGPVPIITAALPDGILYWRLASFTPRKDWADLAGELRTMIDDRHVVGAVLDLRSNMTPDDYAGAAQVANFFVPGDSTFFKYLPQKGDSFVHMPLTIPDHQFQGPLVVLINDQTTGAAEALSSCLKANGALLVGRATTGTSSFLEEHKLTTGQILRFMVAQPNVSDAGQPLVPDIALTEDDHTEKAALTLIRDNHISDVIQESAERHRLSEASLVKGQDPELDEYLTSLERKPVLLSLPVIHDTVLISALDSLRAIRLSQRPFPVEAAANAPASATTSSVQ
jgi:hypothetical protein